MSKNFIHGVLVVFVIALSISNILMAQHVSNIESALPDFASQLNSAYEQLHAKIVAARVTPLITTLTPWFGPVGTRITIRGKGFLATNTVMFDFGSIPNVRSTDGRTLSFTVPSRIDYACTPGSPCPTNTWQDVVQRSYTVAVTNAAGTSNGLLFYVTTQGTSNAVSVASISPKSGKIGTKITLTGKGFTAKDNTVIFGSYHRITGIKSSNLKTLQFAIPATITYPCVEDQPCPTSMTSPVYPGTWYVSVTNGKGTSNTIPVQVK